MVIPAPAGDSGVPHGSGAAAGWTVTLFGSGRDTADIALAEEVGRGVAERGWILRNGGYGGTMEAAARAARGAGGVVEGVTCRAFGRSGPNAFLSRELASDDLFGRLAALIRDADAFGAFPGGTGTLNEVFLTWELMVKGLLPSRPLCLIGAEWDPWWATIHADPALAEHVHLLLRARTAGAAIELLAAPAGSARSAGAGE